MSGERRRPCGLEGPGHAMRPINHWRRMPANTRYDVDRLEEVGPDMIRFLLGPQLGGGVFPPLRPGPGRERIALTYCNHDVPAILEVYARVGQGTHLWFDASGVKLEWAGEDRVIHFIPLCEPYRYQPCRDLSSDPRWPFGALTVPPIPELDQLAEAGVNTKLTVWKPPDEDAEDEARFAQIADGEGSDDVDDEDDEDDAEEDWEELDDEEELTGERVATLRIGPCGWFDGASSELLAISPDHLAYLERWDDSEPGDAVTWRIDPDAQNVAAASWIVREIDRLLEGFPASRHLLRLIADGTVEDRFMLVHDGDDGEESFAVRFTIVADDLEVRAAARDVAVTGIDWTEDGVRADGVWRLVVPGRRTEPTRERVVLTLERDACDDA